MKAELLEKPNESLQPADQIGMFERLAKDQTISVEKIERLMALWERAEAKKAEMAFNAAMSAAQAEMRPVAADAENPQTRSRYASYEALDRALRSIYTAHGFALSFNTGDAAVDYVRVLCDVTHIGGHTKPYKADMPADGKGAKGGDVMTKTHATGSAMSYGQRYLLKMIFNVAVGENDDDGNSATAKQIPAPPTGFLAWWEGMADVVPEGLARYRDEWRKSPQEFCDYVLTYKRESHEALKKQAQQADAARKAAK